MIEVLDEEEGRNFEAMSCLRESAIFFWVTSVLRGFGMHWRVLKYLVVTRRSWIAWAVEMGVRIRSSTKSEAGLGRGIGRASC